MTKVDEGGEYAALELSDISSLKNAQLYSFTKCVGSHKAHSVQRSLSAEEWLTQGASVIAVCVVVTCLREPKLGTRSSGRASAVHTLYVRRSAVRSVANP